MGRRHDKNDTVAHRLSKMQRLLLAIPETAIQITGRHSSPALDTLRQPKCTFNPSIMILRLISWIEQAMVANPAPAQTCTRPQGHLLTLRKQPRVPASATLYKSTACAANTSADRPDTHTYTHARLLGSCRSALHRPLRHANAYLLRRYRLRHRECALPSDIRLNPDDMAHGQHLSCQAQIVVAGTRQSRPLSDMHPHVRGPCWCVPALHAAMMRTVDLEHKPQTRLAA